jgi:hypothetical protein
MGNLLGSLVWGVKSGQYCVIGGGSLQGEPVEGLEEFKIGDSGKKVRIGSQLPQLVKEDLVAFLRRNSDVFAWSHEYMPGIDPSVIVHKLNVDPNHRPVK